MELQQVVTGLSSAIIGGIIGTVLKAYLDKKKDIDVARQKINEEKYKNMLIFMTCVLDIDKRRYFSMNEQVPNETSDDYMSQIKEYYYHSLLYASDDVIKKLKVFIDQPNQINYVGVAKAMRSDLWRNNSNLSFEQISLS